MSKEYNEKDNEFLKNPLTTEDGFINQACLNELDKALKEAGRPAYQRLSNDEEWTVKRWTFITEILGSFAKYAIQLSPYTFPDNLEQVVKYLDACLKKSYEWEVIEGKHWAQISLCDINKMLHDILMEQNIEYFDNWNKKKKDIPRVSGDPDTEFIDLYALLHNVCLDLRTERREFDRFNEEFGPIKDGEN